MKELFKGLKTNLSNFFADYHYGESNKKTKNKNTKKFTKELAKSARKMAEKKSIRKAPNPTFQKALNYETQIKYTSKVTVKTKYKAELTKIWNANKKDLVPKKPTKQEQKFIEYLEGKNETATDKWAKNVEIKHINDKVGYGLFAKKDIPSGTVICQYAGELCLLDEAKDNGYLFGFPETVFQDWVIDPRTKGNYSQFMNHASVRSKKNNIEVEYFYWNAKPRIFFIADRKVEKGEQLLFDYGKEYWEDVGFRPSRF